MGLLDKIFGWPTEKDLKAGLETEEVKKARAELRAELESAGLTKEEIEEEMRRL